MVWHRDWNFPFISYWGPGPANLMGAHKIYQNVRYTNWLVFGFHYRSYCWVKVEPCTYYSGNIGINCEPGCIWVVHGLVFFKLTVLEFLLTLYFLGGIYSAFYYDDFVLIPFHIMLFLGFGYVTFYSLLHSRKSMK